MIKLDVHMTHRTTHEHTRTHALTFTRTYPLTRTHARAHTNTHQHTCMHQHTVIAGAYQFFTGMPEQQSTRKYAHRPPSNYICTRVSTLLSSHSLTNHQPPSLNHSRVVATTAIIISIFRHNRHHHRHNDIRPMCRHRNHCQNKRCRYHCRRHHHHHYLPLRNLAVEVVEERVLVLFPVLDDHEEEVGAWQRRHVVEAGHTRTGHVARDHTTRT